MFIAVSKGENQASARPSFAKLATTKTCFP